MKTTKEKADELVKKFYYHEFDKVETHEATIHAINAVEHTIEMFGIKLSELSKNRQENESSMWVLESLISEQTELLKELESRV